MLIQHRSQRWNNIEFELTTKATLLKRGKDLWKTFTAELSFSTKYQRRNNVKWALTINFVSTLIQRWCVCWVKLQTSIQRKIAKQLMLNGKTLITRDAGIKLSAYKITSQNPVVSPNFMVWKFCEKAHESPETMQKLCLSTKFRHHEIRWNYGILSSVCTK